jgi:hypothetical protein
MNKNQKIAAYVAAGVTAIAAVVVGIVTYRKRKIAQLLAEAQGENPEEVVEKPAPKKGEKKEEEKAQE